MKVERKISIKRTINLTASSLKARVNEDGHWFYEKSAIRLEINGECKTNAFSMITRYNYSNGA